MTIPNHKLEVKLKPNSSSNKIVGFKDSILKVQTTATPEKGKANEALIEILSKALKTAKSNIEIIKGFKSSNKTLIINNITETEIKERIS